VSMDYLCYPGPWPQGASWASFKFCQVVLKERRRGPTGRLGWRFVSYVCEHGGRLADALERGDTSEYEEVCVAPTRYEAHGAGRERLRELASEPANWKTGSSSRYLGGVTVHRRSSDNPKDRSA
jgi:hypothetical protein